MNDTIVVCGYGPGISRSVALRFGAAGFRVALVSRTASKLEAAAAELWDQGIVAAPFPMDLTDVKAVNRLFSAVNRELGAVTVVHWNAADVSGAGDLLTATKNELDFSYALSTRGIAMASQAMLPHLRRAGPAGALLITNGAFGLPSRATVAANARVMGLAMSNAAKHQLSLMLNARLRGEGVFVGEVMVAGEVLPEPAEQVSVDASNSLISGSDVADAFWSSLYVARRESVVIQPGPLISPTDEYQCRTLGGPAALLQQSSAGTARPLGTFMPHEEQLAATFEIIVCLLFAVLFGAGFHVWTGRIQDHWKFQAQLQRMHDWRPHHSEPKPGPEKRRWSLPGGPKPQMQ